MSKVEGHVEVDPPKVPTLSRIKPSGSRIPRESLVFRRFLPALIVSMGVLTAILILVAVGVLLGIVPFR